MEGLDLDDVGSSHLESVLNERQLRTDFSELEKTALYGTMGTSVFERKEQESWFPADAPEEGPKAADPDEPEREQWWQEFADSGFVPSSGDLDLSGTMMQAGTSHT